MATTAKKRERIVVRFAGDSGDGMQLAGSRFTAATALVGNDLATLPDFPAEIRAPAGTLARRLGLPDPVRLARHPHPGRPPERARGDEPGGAAGQPARSSAGGTVIVNEDAFTRRQPAQGRLRRRTRSRTGRSRATRSSGCR